MKKNLLLLCLACAGIAAFGQSPIPNGGFENWTSTSFDNPQNYPNSSNFEGLFRYHLPANVTKITEAYHGTYAVQLTTNASATDTAFGYFINIQPENAPSAWVGGMAYDKKPTGLRGWYKYNVASGDSGTIIVAFSQGGNNIGTYIIKLGGIHAEYTLFNYTFSPALSAVPDSVAFGALSCSFLENQDKPSGPAGSTLILDSVSFTGVDSQPELLNGDFELWETQTFNSPDDWYLQTDNGAGISRTEDAAVGDYAVELETITGNQDNHPVARPGRISTGFYPDNCSGECYQLGGFPYTIQKDTLAFYYKYAPTQPEDNAWINISLKKDGIPIWGQGMMLPASEEYMYTEFPFDGGQEPDSVIIDIQSSQWQDTLLSYVGAILKIDDIHFKSQIIPTGIFNLPGKKSFNVFPNPTNGIIRVQGLNSDIQHLEIFNLSGEMVYSASDLKKMSTNEIDLSKNSKGVYFIKIRTGNSVQTEKLVIR